MKKIQHKPVVVEEKLAAPSVLTSSTCKQSNEKKIKMKKSNSNGLQLVKALSVNLCDIKSNHVSFSFKDNTLVKLGQKLREKTSEKNISFKSNQNNYLKNLSAFKSKGFFSMTSISPTPAPTSVPVVPTSAISSMGLGIDIMSPKPMNPTIKAYDKAGLGSGGRGRSRKPLTAIWRAWRWVVNRVQS